MLSTTVHTCHSCDTAWIAFVPSAGKANLSSIPNLASMDLPAPSAVVTSDNWLVLAAREYLSCWSCLARESASPV